MLGSTMIKIAKHKSMILLGKIIVLREKWPRLPIIMRDLYRIISKNKLQLSAKYI